MALREAPLAKVVNYHAFFQPIFTKIVVDAKGGLEVTDIMGDTATVDNTVDVEQTTFEAEKRGWQTIRQGDRTLWINQSHIASKVPGGIFRSRNDFIHLRVPELRNLCALFGHDTTGNKFTLMKRLAGFLKLEIDEVAAPTEVHDVVEDPTVIEPEPVVKEYLAHDVKAQTPAPEKEEPVLKEWKPIQTITPPKPSTRVVEICLAVPYGRFGPLIRRKKFDDNHKSDWQQIRGRSIDAYLKCLQNMGTWTVIRDWQTSVDSNGLRWKNIVLGAIARS
jgi:hypothetical protein